MQSRTPLSNALTTNEMVSQVTPLDALRVGRRLWLDCERIHMSALASELGINRATLFRWVGNKDLFTGEVIWSFYTESLEKIRGEATFEGASYLVFVCEQLVSRMMKSRPLHYFISQDPEYAIRILASKDSVVQARSIHAIEGLMAEQEARGAWQPPLPIKDLAYLTVRIAESFLYGEVISDQEPGISHIGKAFRLILADRR